MERVLPYEDALSEVLRAGLALAKPREVHGSDLAESQGRVLAEAIRADRDQPPFPRSTRDGFAVRSADLAGVGGLLVRGMVRAGERWTGAALGGHEAIEIMTGAPVPEGADAVLMIEHAAQNDKWVIPDTGRRLRPGENIVPRGAEALAGTELVPVGSTLGAPQIALAASCGYAQVQVYGQPSVAIVATGDELVELDRTPEAWQIRNSNSYALAALVAAEGGVAHRLSVARDTREELRERLAEARKADLVLLSGGVSMGKYDLVEEVLRELGAEFLFTGAHIQPGKPVVFGRLQASESVDSPTGMAEADRPQGDEKFTYFFGLPGNPISTEVCFRLFVAPLLRALAGATELAPRFAEARLAEDVGGGAKVTRFLPAIIRGDWDGVSVTPVPWHGSGDLAANGRANGFLVLPLRVEPFRTGETVRVLLR